MLIVGAGGLGQWAIGFAKAVMPPACKIVVADINVSIVNTRLLYTTLPVSFFLYAHFKDRYYSIHIYRYLLINRWVNIGGARWGVGGACPIIS